MCHILRQERSTGHGMLTRPHVPYRNSMLTAMLKDSLGGNCATAMLATISSEASQLEACLSPLRLNVASQPSVWIRFTGNLDLEVYLGLQESIATCRFAQRVAMITNEVCDMMAHGTYHWDMKYHELQVGFGSWFCKEFQNMVYFLHSQVTVNEEVDPALVVERLHVENAMLKSELR